MKKNSYHPPCDKCGGKCCNYIAIEIGKPKTKRDFDYIRWYLLHRDVNVFIDHSDKWHLEFRSVCESLSINKKCISYDKRPAICRKHGREEGDCEYFDLPYKRYFKTEEEFIKYLGKLKINWRFKRT